MYCYIWTYRVRPEHVAAFEAGYGPDGDWVRLFQRATGYQRTEMLRDVVDPGRFATIDYWDSQADHDAFRREFADEFAAIDRRFEMITESETRVGHFTRASVPRDGTVNPRS